MLSLVLPVCMLLITDHLHRSHLQIGDEMYGEDQAYPIVANERFVLIIKLETFSLFLNSDLFNADILFSINTLFNSSPYFLDSFLMNKSSNNSQFSTNS